MKFRLLVIDEKRFCPVGTMDLTYTECSALNDPAQRYTRLPEQTIDSTHVFGALDVKTFSFATVRGGMFWRYDDHGRKEGMVHVVVRGDAELNALRRTGRFRDWDADLRVKDDE